MTESDYILYRQRLVVARRKLKLRQRDVADTIGVDRKIIMRRETGIAIKDHTADILQLYREKGINANWVLTGRGPLTIEDCVECEKKMKRQAAIRQYPWVSPTDGLPHTDRPVLVVGRDSSGRRHATIGCVDDNRLWHTQSFPGLSIDLWMPIPPTTKIPQEEPE